MPLALDVGCGMSDVECPEGMPFAWILVHRLVDSAPSTQHSALSTQHFKNQNSLIDNPNSWAILIND